MPSRSIIAALATAAVTFISAHALGVPVRGRSPFDATGSDLVRNGRLDYAYIRGETQTYAEQHGLAGAPITEVRRNYVYVEDADGTLAPPFANDEQLYAGINFALRETLRITPDDRDFIIIFTTFETGVTFMFYYPESNDIAGIGDQLYDMNGSSPRQGVVFMNYWREFEEVFRNLPPAFVRGQAKSVFNQEVGHRWASFVKLGATPNGTDDLLLGRDDQHWSYFLHTGGSPLEGNAWRDEGNGRFTTTTDGNNSHYSPLDQYLMGLIEPAQVPSFFAIQNPVVENDGVDIFGDAITKSSTPQVFNPVSATGTRVDLDIQGVIARNGARVPNAASSPKRWRALFVMLAGRTSPLTAADGTAFERMVDEYAAGFAAGTDMRGSLDYELIPTAPKSPAGGPCQIADDCDGLGANTCVFDTKSAPAIGVCTRPCSTASSCPSSWCCAPMGTPNDVCLPEAMCLPPAPPPPPPPAPPPPAPPPPPPAAIPPPAPMTDEEAAPIGPDGIISGGCACDAAGAKRGEHEVERGLIAILLALASIAANRALTKKFAGR